ncbi:hypothetical protein [Candidatus Methanoperedens sp. BLZ2]|uniref:hypothetical protein n=1 Tax=Candidatus Methanoperedens sp. BLZ2 TaxID=2035255 RepID=UPI001142D254|nr:hypothetical protein [Candidatus Methanoperedens sp. BLZ2]MBZ0176043.1 hypothetical protein [Candidatus Methanoperedens nitroreducens]
MGDSNQSKYIFRYLDKWGASTCVVEKRYIDKDYIIDYSKFYARSFKEYDKFTTRLHFFSEAFSDDVFENALIKGDEIFFEKLRKSYLGFVVKKPIENSIGDPLIGRTILKKYPADDNKENEDLFHISDKYNVSLFGIPLEIDSLPFQPQDRAVGACATAACWTALHPLNTLFGVQKYSPFEVTEKSVSFPSLEERNFPSTGLTLLQMKSYFNSINLETEFIDIEKIKKLKDYTSKDDIVIDAVRAFTGMGLPVIAALILFTDEFLFGWDEIPGNDNRRLIEFLIRNFGINWVEFAEIAKTDDNRSIKLSYENNFLSLKLNNEISKVELKINESTIAEFHTKIEYGKVNIYKKNLHGKHAAVISGYNQEEGIIKELYIHDDQIGPYSRVLPVGNFTQWRNEWTELYGCSDVLVYKLMVPIYPKIRMSFISVYQGFLKKKRKLEKRQEGLIPQLYLMQVKKYKKFLLKKTFNNKIDILKRPFPRFVWIIRLLFRNTPTQDYIYDGTSVYLKEKSIDFKN